VLGSSIECVRRETSSIGDLNQAITPTEWNITEVNRAGCKLDIFELGAVLECEIADSLEVFVADDALEGGAIDERRHIDAFEIIGEGDAREGEAVLECVLADSFEGFVTDNALEGSAIGEQTLFDDCELIGESDALEGGAPIKYRLS